MLISTGTADSGYFVGVKEMANGAVVSGGTFAWSALKLGVTANSLSDRHTLFASLVFIFIPPHS